MLLGEVGGRDEVWELERAGEDWDRRCLGTFYIKPNYPGRSSHVCNGGFIVTDAARNRGVGRLMGEGYLDWAPKLVSILFAWGGHCKFVPHLNINPSSAVLLLLEKKKKKSKIFLVMPFSFENSQLTIPCSMSSDVLTEFQNYTYSVFNLVYETNVASIRIWDALGFKRIGRVKGAGNLRSSPNELVDAIVYGRDLGPEGEDFVSEERFDKIRFYLKHGKYPNGADRAEKSRLRSAATHYKLLPAEDDDEPGSGKDNERLMLKDKEVVSDPQRQYEIARRVHAAHHGGINKTTATIAEKHHWVRIKETVSLVIKNCQDCKDASKVPPVRPTGDGPAGGALSIGGGGGHARRAANSQITDPNSMIERLVNFDALEEVTGRRGGGGRRKLDREESLSRESAAGLRALQHFAGIPLDPQIIQHQQPQFNHESSSRGGNISTGATSDGVLEGASSQISANFTSPGAEFHHSTHGGDDADFELDIDPAVHQHHDHIHDDTRMATDRHIRDHDEPMSFVNDVEYDVDAGRKFDS